MTRRSAPLLLAAAALLVALPSEGAPKAQAPRGDHPVLRVAQGPQRRPKPKAKEIKWSGPLKWTSWSDAEKEARKTGNPICLVVYADWCPHCQRLAPLFKDPDLVKAARGVIMVRQDSDARPPWLAKRFGKYGGYVPRTFMLKPDGTVREDLNSGNARYPYFYTPGQIGRLKENLRKLSARKP